MRNGEGMERYGIVRNGEIGNVKGRKIKIKERKEGGKEL